MLRQLAPSEWPAELIPREVGIGRPITAESLDNVMEAFHDVMPQGVSLIPREIPGIVYASATIMSKLVERSSHLDQSQAPAFAARLITSFCENGTFHATSAHQPASLKIDRIKWRGAGDSNRLLQLRLLDKQKNGCPNGYLVDGEKRATMKALSLQPELNDYNNSDPSKALLRLGLILGKAHLVTPTLLNELADAVDGKIEVQRVDLVSAQ